MLFILERKRKYEPEGENCTMKKAKSEKKKLPEILKLSCLYKVSQKYVYNI